MQIIRSFQVQPRLSKSSSICVDSLSNFNILNSFVNKYTDPDKIGESLKIKFYHHEYPKNSE